MNQEQIDQISPRKNFILVNIFRTVIAPLLLFAFLQRFNFKFIESQGLTKDFLSLLFTNVMLIITLLFIRYNALDDLENIDYLSINVRNKVSRILQYIVWGVALIGQALFALYIGIMVFYSVIAFICMFLFQSFYHEFRKESLTGDSVDSTILFIGCILVCNWFFNKQNGEYLDRFYRDVSEWRRKKDLKLIEYQNKDEFPIEYVKWSVDWSDRVPSVIYFIRPIFIYGGRYLVNAAVFLGKKFKAQRLVIVIRAFYFIVDCLISGVINFFVWTYRGIFYICRFSVFAVSNIAFIVCLAFSCYNLYASWNNGGWIHLLQSCFYTCLGIVIWQSLDLVYLNLKRGY